MTSEEKKEKPGDSTGGVGEMLQRIHEQLKRLDSMPPGEVVVGGKREALLTASDVEILSRQSDETLIQWALDLNRWRWPEDLPDEETPEQYQAFMLGRGGPGVKRSRRGAITRWIEAKVSKKRILRAHNARMSDEEFEDFWRGEYEGDPEAHARDEARRVWDSRSRWQPWQETLCDEAEFFDVFDVIGV